MRQFKDIPTVIQWLEGCETTSIFWHANEFSVGSNQINKKLIFTMHLKKRITFQILTASCNQVLMKTINSLYVSKSSSALFSSMCILCQSLIFLTILSSFLNYYLANFDRILFYTLVEETEKYWNTWMSSNEKFYFCAFNK